MGTVATTESLTELAKVLESFFKGLTECGLLTTYSVQLQGSAVDIGVEIKFQYLLRQFVKSLQTVLVKVPTIPGHEYKKDIGTQEPEQDPIAVQPSSSSVPEQLGSLVEACVFTEAQDPLAWVEDEERGLIAQSKALGNTTDIIVTCHPATLAAITNHNFVATPITEIASATVADSILLKSGRESASECNSTDVGGSPPQSLSGNETVISEPASEHPSTTSANYIDAGTQNGTVTNLKPFMTSSTFNTGDDVESLILETYEEEYSTDCESIDTSATSVMHIVVASTARVPTGDSPKVLVVESENGSENVDAGAELENTADTFHCDICDRKFRSACSLKIHLSVKHRSRGQCDLCEQKFPSVQGLQEHCRTEHGGRGCFNCDDCGKRFMTKLSFRRHVDTHGGKKKAVCDMCGKAFSRPDYLQKHYMTHTGHRPFHCPLCPRKFISSSQLRVHQRTHTGVKDHICDMCNKAFSRSDKLKDHMLRHLNIKRFHCTTCKRDYAEKRDLNKHLKVHMI